MSLTFTAPLMGLDSMFPETLFVVHHPSTDRYGCYLHDGVHGVACFSDEAGAIQFAQLIELHGMVSREVSFDEAREVAKSRPLPVISLILLDSMESPEVHFVR